MRRRYRIRPTRLSQAFALAQHLHEGQLRKVHKDEDQSLAVPYITHVTEVMSLMVQAHASEDQLIAGLLHDALEDQPQTASGADTATVIRKNFGRKVLAYVEHCSDALPAPGEAKPPWRERKEAHLRHMRAQARKDPRFLLVTLCDKISNARAIVDDVEHHGDIVWRRFNASPPEIAWYYGEMLQVIKDNRKRLPHSEALVARLDKHVARLTELAAQVPAG